MRPVLRRTARLLRAVPLTTGYVTLLLASAVWLQQTDASTRSRVLHGASSNLSNLQDGRLHVLLTSALVVVPPAGGSLVAGAALLAAGEQLLGSWRVAGVFALGHTSATLAVSALLQADALPGVQTPATRSAVDVGLSYGVLAVAGALATAGPRRTAPWLTTLSAVVVVPLLRHPPTFTAWGHVFSAGIGVAAGVVQRPRTRSTA